jgi:hypothetical protein
VFRSPGQLLAAHPVWPSHAVKPRLVAPTRVAVPAVTLLATALALLCKAHVALTGCVALATVTAEVVAAQLGAVLLVNVKVVLPTPAPVTTPALVTVATPVLLLSQVPPETGDKVVVPPIQVEVEPVILTTGGADIATADVVLAQLGAAVVVNVKVGLPAATALTTPAFVTVASELLLLAQVPPEIGDKVVLPPLEHIEDAPVILTAGGATMATAPVVAAQLGTVLLVNVKVGLPAATALTAPAFVTVASELLLLAQVPPLVGDKVVAPLVQIEDAPVILTDGRAVTVIADPPPVAEAAHVVTTTFPAPVVAPAGKGTVTWPLLTKLTGDAAAPLIVTVVPPFT